MKREDCAGRMPHIQQNTRTDISIWLQFTRKLPPIRRTVLDPKPVKAWSVPSPPSHPITSCQNEPESAHQTLPQVSSLQTLVQSTAYTVATETWRPCLLPRQTLLELNELDLERTQQTSSPKRKEKGLLGVLVIITQLVLKEETASALKELPRLLPFLVQIECTYSHTQSLTHTHNHMHTHIHTHSHALT